MSVKATMLSSIACIALAVPAVAQAQQAEEPKSVPAADPASDSIVVTGVRASIQSAVNAKRNADQVADIVAAEDLGKLPDANVAENLQRVPGVQIERNFGEGAQVTVRGLSNVRVELNGRSNLGISVGPTGSDPSGRSTGLEQQSSTLFSRLSVYKSPTADQIEGGLGGFISMTTPRPFDFKKPTISYLAEYTNTNLARNRNGYNLALFGTTRLLDDRLGVAVNVAYSDREIGSSQFIRGVWNPGTTTGMKTDFNGDGQLDYTPQIARSEFYRIKRKRFGAGGTLQFQATDNLMLYADALYTHLETQRHIEYLAIQTTDTGANASTLTNGVMEGNYVVAGTLTNQRVRVGGVERNEPTTSLVAGGGAVWKVGRLNLKADFGKSVGDYTYRQDFMELASRGLTINYDYRTGDVPNITLPAGFDLTARASYPTRSNSAANDTIVHTLETAYRLDGSYDLDWGMLKSLQFGGRYADLTSDYRDYQAKLNATNPNIATLPDSYFVLSNNPGYPGATGNFPSLFLVPDVYAGGTGDDSLLLSNYRPTRPRPTTSYYISEKTKAVYGRANLDGELLGIGFRGNIGLRAVWTDFAVDTTADVGGGVMVPRHDTSHYSNLLPSANIKFSLARDLVLRLAASKVMSRAKLQDLAPRLAVNGPLGTASGGNSNLRPTRADQLDASLEYYIPGGGIASATAFYKNITDQVARTTIVEVIPGFESYGPLQRSLPINLGVAKVKGIELNYQQAFTFLPGLLSGFGTQLNATFIDTSSSDNQPVLGLSKTTYNGILYYERGPFTARVAYNWRSKSALSFTTTPATGQLRPNWYSSDDQVDASIGFKVTKYATLSAGGTNLFYKKSGRTNYNQMIDAVNGYEISDRQFRIGIRGRF